jgi:hypothetical protein
MTRQRPAFNRLALAAALLFAVWQGISLQHLHASESPQADCAVCAAAQFDDTILDTTVSIGLPSPAGAEIPGDVRSIQPPQPFSAYGARAPPIS